MGPLTLMTFIPTLGAIAILLLPRERRETIKWFALFIAALPLAISIYIYLNFNTDTAALQFAENTDWIKAYNIKYFMAADGISITMIILTALLCFLCIPASWNINKGTKGYFALFLLLETGMLGVFCAIDLFLFYVFWELMLLPMYFLIGIWGGPRKEYAAIKFFLYTLFGSVFMLLAILALYFYGGDPHTFDIMELMKRREILQSPSLLILGLPFAKIVFIALFIGFVIKVPMFPFHTWLPDAHVEAPTAVSVILAGVLLKMGTYGIIRVCYQVLPGAAVWFAPMLAVFASINIIYGALCAMYQTDFKKLVAYSSVSHMGYVLLGLAAMTDIGFHGAVLQMFNHGMATGMLFLLVGVLYDRAHHRDINGFGGIASKVPIYTGFVTLAFFASMGLPGLANFISEALTLIGSFNADSLFSPSMITEMWFTGNNLFRICTILGALGVIITAAYLLWTFQRIFLGPLNEKYKDLLEINKREIFTLVPLSLLILILGIYPSPVLKLITPSLNNLVNLLRF